MNFLSRLAGGDNDAGEDGAAGSGGGGGWLAALKEKSKEIAEVYKRDIGALFPCQPRPHAEIKACIGLSLIHI